MPRHDGSGPLGRGPLTGRGWGLCQGFNAGRGFQGKGLQCARGFGYGFSGGFRRGWNGPGNPAWNDRQALEDYQQYLEEELAMVKKKKAED